LLRFTRHRAAGLLIERIATGRSTPMS
jgi:hypothetical protein